MDFHIQHFDSLDSTNKEVLRQAATGAAEGLVVLANTQTEGKGRLGRTWETIEHALAMSVLLRPNIPTSDVPQLSLLAAVALQKALAPFVPRIGIKWPNDLLIHGKKVCGILTETQKNKQGIAVVLGMGINIHEPEQGWPNHMRTPPTSLNRHSPQNIHKDIVLQSILESLDTWYAQFIRQGFTPVRQAWQHAHLASGKMVSVYDGSTYIQGTALGLDNDGALRLLVNGQEQRIIAGDVSIMDNPT